MIDQLLKGLLILPLLSVAPQMAYAAVKYDTATFAGGCFWCMEEPFAKMDGVKQVIAGYAGGNSENPTYQDYAQKGYIEAIQITYDPMKVAYPELLKVYWRQIDPTDEGGQFCDRGPQYRSAIFYHSNEQKQQAETGRTVLDKSGRYHKPVVTEIIKASTFYLAEAYHQDYAKKNPIRYKFYRFNCGRDQYLKKIWGNALKETQTAQKKNPSRHL